MPYKDRAVNTEHAKKSYERLYSRAVAVRIRNNEPDFDVALTQASADQKITQAEYLRQSAYEKLIRDGYLPAPEE